MKNPSLMKMAKEAGSAMKLKKEPMKMKKAAPMKEMKDLSGDNKVTQKDVLIGRGVLDKEGKPTVNKMKKDPAMKLKKDNAMKMKKDPAMKLKKEEPMKMKKNGAMKMKKEEPMKMKKNGAMKMKKNGAMKMKKK